MTKIKHGIRDEFIYGCCLNVDWSTKANDWPQYKFPKQNDHIRTHKDIDWICILTINLFEQGHRVLVKEAWKPILSRLGTCREVYSVPISRLSAMDPPLPSFCETVD